MGLVLFLYDFVFAEFENPPGTKERFTEGLRAFFVSRDLDYSMSALGGTVHTFGDVRGRPVTEDDRRALARWAGSQRVRCTARLGALEEYSDDFNLLREITEWVFQVDNLTDEDRAEAAAYQQRIRELIRSLQRGRTRPDAGTDPTR